VVGHHGFEIIFLPRQPREASEPGSLYIDKPYQATA
jgi:hypothetical protein